MKFVAHGKLWHLLTVVAAAAFLLAIATSTALTPVSAGLLGLIFLPPLWAAFVWDCPIRRFLGMSPSPADPAESLMVGFLWFWILLIPHTIIILTMVVLAALAALALGGD